LKKGLILKCVKESLTTGKVDYMKTFLPSLIIFFSICMVILSGCGLFYEFEPEEDLAEQDISIGEESAQDLYMVSEVIDGDTIILSNGDRIRFLGINTPEKGMYFYMESKDVLKIMIYGKNITLEKDISDCDLYGRKLRYVFLKNTFINLEMVKRGYANTYTYPPDVKYGKEILMAERYARENNLGLWELSEFKDICVEVFYDAPGNDNENKNGEYVVIENTGSSILNTLDWTIKDSGTNIYVFGSGEFYPGAKITLFSGKGADGEDVLYWNSRRPVWNNDFDTLYMRDADGLLMCIYNY